MKRLLLMGLWIVWQVRSIIGQVRPDRQTLLFSATMPNKVERLVQDALTSPVRITVGEIGAANDDIRQVLHLSSQDDSCLFILLQDTVIHIRCLLYAKPNLQPSSTCYVIYMQNTIYFAPKCIPLLVVVLHRIWYVTNG